MFARILLIAVAASVACANPMWNSFIDRVLSEVGDKLGSMNLDPAPVTPFKVFDGRDRFDGRDFRANFTGGSIRGLANFFRTGDCSRWEELGSIYTRCRTRTKDPLKVRMNAVVKGDNGNEVHSIEIGTDFEVDEAGIIEIRGGQGDPGELYRIIAYIWSIRSSVIKGELHLKNMRRSSVHSSVLHEIKMQYEKLLTVYGQAINQTLSKYRMP